MLNSGLNLFLLKRKPNQFWWTIVSLILIVPMGFYCKSYNGPWINWVNDSLAGLFYVIFWCLLVFLFLPNFKPLIISLWVLIITCTLEFLQLWHPPLLEYFRGFFLGGVILGTSFAWSDFPYYFLGSIIGWFWLRKISTLK